MPLFKSSPKSPQELAKGLKEALGVLSSGGGAKRTEKAADESAKILGQIKVGALFLSGHLPDSLVFSVSNSSFLPPPFTLSLSYLISSSSPLNHTPLSPCSLFPLGNVVRIG